MKTDKAIHENVVLYNKKKLKSQAQKRTQCVLSGP